MIKWFFQYIADEFSGLWIDLKMIFNPKYYNSEEYKLEVLNQLAVAHNVPQMTMEEFREWKKNINDNTVVYKGKWLEMHNVDGYEFMNRHRKPKAVDIIALTSNNELIICRQFRKAVNAFVWETPAGLVDEGESSEQTAIRELLEETGYSGTYVETIEKVCTTPGICTELIDVVIFNNCIKVGVGGGLENENEHIETVLFHPTTDFTSDLQKTGLLDFKLLFGIEYAKNLYVKKN